MSEFSDSVLNIAVLVLPVLIFFILIWSAMLAGGVFLIVSSVRKKKKQSTRFGIAFLAITIGLPTIGLLLFLADIYDWRKTCSESGISEGIVLGGILAAAGVIGLIAVILFSIRSGKKFRTRVEATCVDEEHGVFAFTLNGEPRTVSREVNWRRHYRPKAGETKTLYIDENDLTDFYDPSADKGSKIYLKVFLSVVFTALTVLGIFILVQAVGK